MDSSEQMSRIKTELLPVENTALPSSPCAPLVSAEVLSYLLAQTILYKGILWDLDSELVVVENVSISSQTKFHIDLADFARLQPSAS